MMPRRLEKRLRNAAYYNMQGARKVARLDPENPWRKALHGDTDIAKGDARLHKIRKEMAL